MLWEGIDKRNFPRVKHRCLIQISKADREERIDTFTENIGAGGICVIVSKPFEIFDTVSLELHLDDGGSPIQCKGSVVWTVRDHTIKGEGSDNYDTGIEFIEISDEDRNRISGLVEGLLSSEA